jgi:hypothetical protein
VCFALLVVTAAHADDSARIEYLLTTVSTSDCTFIRNGTEHTAAAAADHLRMKYQRGKFWVKDAEAFIERIASRSTLSGEPYRVRCPGQAPQATREWLLAQLAAYTR